MSNRNHELVPTMTLSYGVKVVDQVWERWEKLPPHRVLLRVNRPGILEFAALDWKRRPIHVGLDAADDRAIGNCAFQIADALQIVHKTWPDSAAWLACPFVQCDLEGEVRMGFISAGRDSWPIERLPPEIYADWPRCDERALVFAAGQATLQLVENIEPGSLMGAIFERAMHPIPAQRFATLHELMMALRDQGVHPSLRNSLAAPRTVWSSLEQGLGFYMLRDYDNAQIRFQRAVARNRNFEISRQLRDLASVPKPREVAGEVVEEIKPAPPTSVLERKSPGLEISGPRPRRVFAAANGKVARSVITTSPLNPPAAPSDPIHFALRSRDYRGALDLVDAQLVATPDDARAHHLRGKAQFALGRIADARAAFDRACTLDARLLEAMLLRREMDRAMKDAGTANRMALKLPDHLVELRDILVTGRIVDAIQLLRRPAYDDDRTAQLLLAELLITDERLDDALAVFDRLGEQIGKARALLALDRPAEALVALTTDSDDALELRSRILLALGRGDDAERAMDDYLRAVERRSDRRLESR